MLFSPPPPLVGPSVGFYPADRADTLPLAQNAEDRPFGAVSSESRSGKWARMPWVKKVQDKGQSLAGKHRPAGRAEERQFADNSPNSAFFEGSGCHRRESSVTIVVTEMPEKPTAAGFSQSLISHFEIV